MISAHRYVQAAYDATWGRFLFAGAYDRFLRKAEQAGLSDKRRTLVQHASGRTLEIATGTGLNLPYYPKTVSELVLTEPYPHMLGILREKVRGLELPATIVEASAETLPFPDASFDTVVATMILCSAADPELVLSEIQRVLRPGGQYLFLEHVRNSDPSLARRQDWLQPGWFLFANGCHCNRDTKQLLESSCFQIEELRQDRIPKAWKILEEMIMGRARRQVTSRSPGPRRCCQESAA